MRTIIKVLTAARGLRRAGLLPPPNIQIAGLTPSTRRAKVLAGLGELILGKPPKKNPGSHPSSHASHQAIDTDRLYHLLTSLGPAYIKLGQFMATRPDIIGPPLAKALVRLQDNLPPFSQAVAEEIVVRNLQKPLKEIFSSFSKPMAAASIAQVHKARRINHQHGQKNTPTKEHFVAVKIIRPNVEKRITKDMATFIMLARLCEKWLPKTRRLRPVAAMKTLASSLRLEFDLRLEAAALAEIAENLSQTGDDNFTVPRPDWSLTTRNVLVMEWVDGLSLGNKKALIRQGYNLPRLAQCLVQTFLTQALMHGFFHADLHPGNLFVTKQGVLVGVDCGIMGRLEEKTRAFLADILWGFIARDYEKVARAHFNAGYVPQQQDRVAFTQALRSIGEPIAGQKARHISMAHLLGQLFEVTEQFNMPLQPQLLLLQKTMVVVEGVARELDENLNIWTVSEPIVAQWMQAHTPAARLLKQLPTLSENLAALSARLPHLMQQLSTKNSSDYSAPWLKHAHRSLLYQAFMGGLLGGGLITALFFLAGYV